MNGTEIQELHTQQTNLEQRQQIIDDENILPRLELDDLDTLRLWPSIVHQTQLPNCLQQPHQLQQSIQSQQKGIYHPR